jgi:hypothetical protein
MTLQLLVKQYHFPERREKNQGGRLCVRWVGLADERECFCYVEISSSIRVSSALAHCGHDSTPAINCSPGEVAVSLNRGGGQADWMSGSH